MGKVDISINARQYKISCDDGQEERLHRLAEHLNSHVTRLATDLGPIGDNRLLLLASLTICDELFECKSRVQNLESASEALDEETLGGAARVIEAATRRIDSIAKSVA